MRPHLALLSALALATPLFAADTPLTADAFDAATVGKTFFYQRGGISYGAEQSLPDHKVVWAFTGDDCKKGYWYSRGTLICFIYEDKLDPQCWTFTQTADGLSARFDGDTANEPLVALRSSPEPMACMGPDVGA